MAHELISFDPTTHTYEVGGIVYPSVTKILSTAGLSPDFSMILPSVLESKRQLGIDVHEQTQLVDMGAEPSNDGYVQAYTRFKTETDFQPVEIELPVYSKTYGYAGTIDRVGELKGKLSILDIKTTQALDMPYMGPQTAGYEIAYKEWTEYKKIMPRYILQLKPDGTYKLVQCKKKEDTNIFLYALQITKWRNKK